MLMIIALVLVFQASSATADSTRSHAANSSDQSPAAPPQTVEAAEAEGTRYPAAAVTTDQAMYGEAFGPRARQCVDAEGHAAARSGEFVAGAFDAHIMMAGAGRKVWWTPRQDADLPPMHLRAAKLGAPGIVVSWTFPSIVRNENGRFFNTTIRFPERGKWLVVVTSGTNWGCFLLDEL